MNNKLCYISGSKVKNKKIGKTELHIVISLNNPQDALEIYKERCQIESTFKGLKTVGSILKILN
jgi:hypothetical protein